ncbi:2-hydroxyacyl-CoA dehydratase subunit D [Geosporobacter ferrireducens]|uniref:2-hydroxyacyl-CoA dehydratase n=1 Tax=Geosporobacter ferrireducens TaxID=1424294 RepID=A0A1D8GFY3_9FIRM|nr:2-hydroxyacyl-CoA dehydratase family protein [Geosporobacter ferrireducens]AOT69814.1 hypothetical protein Gferi_09620 [Geosporobacter ferrireducens]
MDARRAVIENDAFMSLASAYKEREKTAEKYRNKGKKTVGCIGSDVPEELFIAADYLPIRISADSRISLEDTDEYLEYAFDPLVRSQFQKIIDGTCYSLFDYLVISNSTDVLVRVNYYLREVRRIEPEKLIPSIYFLDILFTRARMYQVYNFNKIKKLKETIEIWNGKEITNRAMKNAIAICNENRELLRQAEALRISDKPKLSGVEALQIIGSSMYMPKEEHSNILKELLKSKEDFPEISGPRIFVTGSTHEDTAFYEMVEGAGAIIIAEDHDFGNRHFDKNVETTDDPIHAILNRYMLRIFSSKKAFVSQRVEALKEQMTKTKPDGVIFFMRQYDDPGSWDYPEQAKMLKELNIPSILLVKQPYDISKAEELREKIDTFIEALK